MADLKHLKKQILSNQGMDDVYGKFPHKKFKPYVLILKNHYFIGVSHTNDPKDPQITKLRGYWQKFIKKDVKKCVALIEANVTRVASNEKKSLIEDSESGLIAFWANQADVNVLWPEPNRDDEITTLSKRFGREKLMYYFAARQALQWVTRDHKSHSDFKNYIEGTIKSYIKHHKPWRDFKYNFVDFQKMHKQMHGRDFALPPTKKDHLDFYRASHPVENPVSGADGLYRDEYILEQIYNLDKRGKSIFMVYGSGHIIRLEPALKELGEP